MEKYIVKVDILKSNKDGNTESEIFEFIYNEENPIFSRKKAVAKARDLLDFYFNELPMENRFISIGEALVSKSKKFNIIKIDIIFSPSEDIEHFIYETPDIGSMLEALEQEAMHYINTNMNPPIAYFHDGYHYGAYILEIDIDFFLDEIDIDEENYELIKNIKL